MTPSKATIRKWCRALRLRGFAHPKSINALAFFHKIETQKYLNQKSKWLTADEIADILEAVYIHEVLK